MNKHMIYLYVFCCYQGWGEYTKPEYEYEYFT